MREFAAGGKTITKLFGANTILEEGVRKISFTRQLDDADLADLRGIETTPAEICAGVRRLMTEMGLAYGALDFVVRPDQSWVFLEINAGGQFGFIEDKTGAPLTDQLAGLLAKGTS